MFGPETVALAVGLLATLSVGGLAYALLLPLAERKEKQQMLNKVAINDRKSVQANRVALANADGRRKQIAEKLKQQQAIIEEKTKHTASSRAPLSVRLMRAGLKWDQKTYYLFMALCGLFLVGVLSAAGAPLFAVVAGGIFGVFAVPSWYINFKAKSRQKKFLAEYPNALDVIVRGMKAGLPLNDCIMIISREAAEPVRGEFLQIVEAQQLGMPTAQAVEKMFRRMPLAEVNFLAIMLAIQGQSGGNLSEPLSNLSKVVRDRKKMKAKITAMSSEAKASASIIAALPVAVITLVYLSTPDYIALLFTEQLGNVMLGACALLMLTGVLIMRKMINFDF
ncbi:MAG: type II secretion system F family protein [Pseudomonadota bacterium]